MVGVEYRRIIRTGGVNGAIDPAAQKTQWEGAQKREEGRHRFKKMKKTTGERQKDAERVGQQMKAGQFKRI